MDSLLTMESTLNQGIDENATSNSDFYSQRVLKYSGLRDPIRPVTHMRSLDSILANRLNARKQDTLFGCNDAEAMDNGHTDTSSSFIHTNKK